VKYWTPAPSSGHVPVSLMGAAPVKYAALSFGIEQGRRGKERALVHHDLFAISRVLPTVPKIRLS